MWIIRCLFLSRYGVFPGRCQGHRNIVGVATSRGIRVMLITSSMLVVISRRNAGARRMQSVGVDHLQLPGKSPYGDHDSETSSIAGTM
jgi:hypothetical protein